MSFLILIVAAYILGSIPFGLVIAKAHGKDLRTIGSGNIGATNIARALGRKWAVFCFCLDAAKGCLPTAVASHLCSSQPTTAELFAALAVAVAAVVGHIFPIYIKFKGGKGVATSFGVALGLWPWFTLCSIISLAAWLVTVSIWRYVSLASIVAALAFPVALTFGVTLIPAWSFSRLWPLFVAAVAIPVMVVIRHRENIKRLFAGTESKVFTKRS